MSTSKELAELAGLAQAAAEQVGVRIQRLGPRPDGGTPAAILWDQTSARLIANMSSLTAMISKVNAEAISAALDGAGADLASLSDVTRKANDRIKTINEISTFLSTLGKILDVGLAILAAAAAPSPTTLAAIVKAIKDLSKATA